MHERARRSVCLRALLSAALAAPWGCADDARPPVLLEDATVPTVDAAPPADTGARGDAPATDAAALPDVPPDVPVPIGPPAPPFEGSTLECGRTTADVARAEPAELVLVLDRSGSMASPMADGQLRYIALRAALREVLPRVEARLRLGLLMFPSPSGSGSAAQCAVYPGGYVTPSAHAASRILDIVARDTPVGGTPLAAALDVVAAAFSSAPAGVRRFVLVATDGAPNCETAPTARPEDRSVERVTRLYEAGSPTLVLGLAGTGVSSALDRLAVAGGQARAVTPRYYPADSARALAAAVEEITARVADCRAQLASAPPYPGAVDVDVAGARVPRDVSHRDGWDWTDGAHREVLFFGEACDRLRRDGGAIAVVFRCPDAL